MVAGLAAIARLNGVKPQAWLTDMLGRVVSGRAKAHELERLLPWAWQAERFAAAWTLERRHGQTTLAMRWQRAGGNRIDH